MERNEINKKSNLLLENRNKVNVSGVYEVVSFNDLKVTLNTVFKKLEILGNNLKISKLDLKNGEVIITGNINQLKYLDGIEKKDSKINIVKKMIGKK